MQPIKISDITYAPYTGLNTTAPILGTAPLPIGGSINWPARDTRWITSDGRKIERPSFMRFFNHEEINEIRDVAQVFCWNYKQLLGNTIRDKAETFAFQLGDIRQSLVNKGAGGLFWLAAGYRICDWLETIAPSWAFGTMHSGQVPFGIAEDHQVSFRGILKMRYRVYCDCLLSNDTVIMGVNDTRQDDSHYARLTLSGL